MTFSLVTSFGLEAQEESGTLEEFLDKLEDLQKDSIGMPSLEGGSPLDKSREKSIDRSLDRNSIVGRQRNIEREQTLGGFTMREQFLIQKFCDGTIKDEDVQVVRFFSRFSRLEQDYCQRVDHSLFQFGYNLFTLETDTSDVLQIGAIGDDYVVGIGDEFIISFQGPNSQTITRRVDREGRLILQDLGAIPTVGRAFSEVRKDIEDRTESVLLGTTVMVSIGAVRELSVTVAGEVVVPGTYTLSSLSTMMDALSSAGGIRKTGSLRTIQVKRGDLVFWVDVYDLHFGASMSSDVPLYDGDYITVPLIGATVAVSGNVMRPGIYELPEGSSTLQIKDLLDLSGGTLRPRGYRLSRITFDAIGRQLIVEQTDDGADLTDGDILVVNRREDVQLGAVELIGHVKVPGWRALSSAQTARALIRDNNSLEDNPYLLFAVIETSDPVTQARRMFPISLLSILASRRDFKLRDGDKLIVLSNEDIRYLSSRDVQGIISVTHTGERIGLDGLAKRTSPLSLDRRRLAETLVANAQKKQDVNRESTSDSDGNSDKIGGDECEGRKRLAALVAQSRPGRFASAVRAVGSSPNQKDFVDMECPAIFHNYPDLLPLALEHVASVNGEVRIPGPYPVLPETSLSHILSVVGGTTRAADLARVEIQRGSGSGRSTRDVIDLARVETRNVSLGPGDSIRFSQVFTDRDNGPVEITGEVAKPGFYHIRRGERLSELVARAGGMTPQAYPLGAIFTRDRVRQAQQIGYERAARELNASLAIAAAQEEVNPVALSQVFEMLSELNTVQALGRVVIEADPTVLQVRPELDSVLEPGDKLFVPKRPSSVLVIGDVLSPGALQFISGTKVDQYIRQAGGFQRSADEDRVFLVYPNGEAQPVAVSVWNYTPVQVPPGSTIVVPKDPAPLNIFQITKEFAQVVSQLAITAASLAVIGNN
tara:strand:+ start:844 stop:3651 length:2808 start_codon:yes stop_codon:yes gene_type:complete